MSYPYTTTNLKDNGEFYDNAERLNKIENQITVHTSDILELKLITNELKDDIDEIKNKKIEKNNGYLIDDTLQHVNNNRYRSTRNTNYEYNLYHDSADMFLIDYVPELIMPDMVSTIDGKFQSIPVIGCHAFKYIEFVNNIRFSKIPHMIWYSSAIINNFVITKVEIPFNIKILPFRLFWGCINLKSVTLSGVEVITMQSFAHCAKIKHLVLPNILASIEDDAFYGCNFERLVILSKRTALEASLEMNPFKNEVKFKYIYAYKNIIEILKKIINQTGVYYIELFD